MTRTLWTRLAIASPFALIHSIDSVGYADTTGAIAASSGSACTSGTLEPSHAMRAMGIPYTAVHGSLRFSLSRYNTETEVDLVIVQLRKLSPYWQDGKPVSEAFAPAYA